ncbi:MAG: MBOAT family O-acyltransferase [Paracoccaceae bacterium]
MVFSSAIFLFGFLPGFLAAYFLTPARFRNVTVLIASYAFYGWWRIDFLGLFVLVTLWNYALGWRVTSLDQGRSRQIWLGVGVAGNLAVLAYFKYFNFGVESFLAMLDVSAGEFSLWSVILPIGISFYIFQAISYLVDVHRGDAPPARNLIDFAAFIALFPQLIAGPVLRYKDLVDQFENRIHSWALFSEGAYRFALGLAMKVLIADSVAPVADLMFALPAPTAAEAWLGTTAYTIQLFFDFAGYSAMAIGLGLMMGFRFMENFDNPYVSMSITEFWRRWHLSLSAWLRDYLYIPLGGSRLGKVRTYLNLFLTMLLGGLWHGASWTFVLWGAWHGVLLAIERAFGVKAQVNAPRHAPRILLTLLLVMIGWVLFRAPDLASAIAVYEGMIGLNGWSLGDEVAWQINSSHVFWMLIGWAVVYGMYFAPKIQSLTQSPRFRIYLERGAALLLVFSAAKVLSSSYSPFLYFQF